MSRENERVVRSLYEAWNRSGVPPWDSIDSDVEVEFAGGILKGTYRGHAGLSEALDSFWSYFEESRIDVEDCLASGEEVVVTLHYFARGKTSGIEVDLRGWHVWTLRGGKAVRWQVFGTKKEALEAAGLRE